MLWVSLLYTIREEDINWLGIGITFSASMLGSASADHEATRRSPAADFAGKFPEGSVDLWQSSIP